MPQQQRSVASIKHLHRLAKDAEKLETILRVFIRQRRRRQFVVPHHSSRPHSSTGWRLHRNIGLHSARQHLIASRFLVFFSSAVVAPGTPRPGAIAIHQKTSFLNLFRPCPRADPSPAARYCWKWIDPTAGSATDAALADRKRGPRPRQGLGPATLISHSAGRWRSR